MLNLKEKTSAVITDSREVSGMEIIVTTNGTFSSFHLVNHTGKIHRISEVVIFRVALTCPGNTGFYAEGFNMLSQYWGTLENIQSTISTDRDHFKLPVKDGFFTCYNLIQLFHDSRNSELLGFTSCRRFTNEIRFNTHVMEFVIDCDNIELKPDETIELEEFCQISQGGREEQLVEFGKRICTNHPALPCAGKLTGWCSWYAYGARVTRQDILNNGATMKKRLPELRFVQLDDGYQAHFGDWLTPHKNFPEGIKSLCLEIMAMGLEPGIWVAPFVAEAGSDVLKDHPDWFVKDNDDLPLPSDRYSFGGWRAAPWYMLDGSHPEACEYVYEVFKTMREDWKCRYFKLDGTMWGCLPFGKRYNPKMTRVEAFRSIMRAIRNGVGNNSMILGCNAPMWPSLGTCSAMRITGDVVRNGGCLKGIARECFYRNWQNGRLWINDADCLVQENLSINQIAADGKILKNSTCVTKEQFEFHLAHILASGGMLLSGDILMNISGKTVAAIEKLLKTYGKTAVFDSPDLRHGVIKLADCELHCCFNWDDLAKLYFTLPLGECFDYWTNKMITDSHLLLDPLTARVICHKS